MTTNSERPTSSARPREKRDPVRWVRQNLFSSWWNTLLTIVAGGLIYWLVSTIVVWAVVYAEWEVVTTNLRLLLVGTYPASEIWRVWLCVVLAAALIGLSWGIWPDVVGGVGPVYGTALLLLALLPFELSSRLWLALSSGLIFGGWLLGRRFRHIERFANTVGLSWVALLIAVLVLLYGFEPLLPFTNTTDWGGLLLTFVLAITGIVFSFPIGVLLAIGRRSSMPAFSGFCTVYIEVFRGVPLVTVLFMFLIMIPLFVPGGENINNIVRAIVGFTLFTAAYIAENVRGGLQSIPKGQFEAARALGLNPVLTMIMIILPQALRVVIPANVNQFVSLFKDTSLVIVAGGGLLELLGRSRNIPSQEAFLGQWLEPFAFAALMFWVFAFSMTYVSRRLENKLNVGHR